MRTVLRAAVATTAAALLALAGAGQASAYTTDVVAWHNGETKGRATFNNSIDELCAHHYKGYQTVALLNGNSVADYTAGGNPGCVWVNNITDGRVYTLTVRWYGTGGAFVTNSINVMG